MFFTKGENKHPLSPFLHPLSSLAKKQEKKKYFGVGLPFGLFEIILSSFDKVRVN